MDRERRTTLALVLVPRWELRSVIRLTLALLASVVATVLFLRRERRVRIVSPEDLAEAYYQDWFTEWRSGTANATPMEVH